MAVGVTLYRPNANVLFALLDVVVLYGGPVLLHVDGPAPDAIDEELLIRLRRDARFRVLQADHNGGIGAALNRLWKAADGLGCEAILFFDQDSSPSATTAHLLREALRSLTAKSLRPAVIGPTPVGYGSEMSKAPTYRARTVVGAPAECRPTDFIIISGSLVPLAIFRDVGPFQAAYGMDSIDVEWCFRAWARGYTVWHLPDAPMPHRVGQGVIEFGRLRFPKQSVERMRSYARNQFHLLRLPHVPLRWKLRTLVYVPLQIAVYVAKSPKPRSRLAAVMLRALIDGLMDRFRGSAGGA